MTSPALLTDKYELTMVQAALRGGSASRHCVFEVFARSLPGGRRYGVLAGTGRLLDMLADFTVDASTLEYLGGNHVVDDPTLDWLSTYRFSGSIDGYPEGEAYFPGSPVVTVEGSFAECVLLETLVLSILNHDTAVATAAARMVCAAGDRPIIEMGTRRTHERAAVASARATYLAGFASTSNLEAGRQWGVPTAGTAAHSFTLLHDDEEAAFRAQVDALGSSSTLLVDTYDVMTGIRRAVAAAGPSLGAIRLDSGDLLTQAREARQLLDSLGADRTRITVSGDLDEFGLAALASAPVDGYGVGTSVVTGSGSPSAGFVYKLVAREGADGRVVPVEKRSFGKATHGGRKTASRRRHEGVATAEVVRLDGGQVIRDDERPLQVPLVRDGKVTSITSLAEARERCRTSLSELPREAMKLSPGDPAIETLYEGAAT